MSSIPVFVSCPTDLSPEQEKAREVVNAELTSLLMEPRALGRSDYPDELPLREVAIIARHCSGGVILGFKQFETSSGVWKPGTEKARSLEKDETAVFPTPWNQLEAGILFGLKLPLMIFREEGIEGGVFDNGVTDVFVHQMPAPPLSDEQASALRQIFLKWHAKVSAHYYAF